MPSAAKRAADAGKIEMPGGASNNRAEWVTQSAYTRAPPIPTGVPMSLFDQANDVAGGAMNATKGAASSVAGTVCSAAHTAGSAAVAAAEKLTGKDLNKDGKIG
jgi:hypothetical protein